MPVGERHGLGVAMLADIVAQAGYDVLNIGADTPPSSLASAIRSRDDLRAIVISVVDATNLPAGARMIAAARRADPAVLIVAGGFAVPRYRDRQADRSGHVGGGPAAPGRHDLRARQPSTLTS